MFDTNPLVCMLRQAFTSKPTYEEKILRAGLPFVFEDGRYCGCWECKQALEFYQSRDELQAIGDVLTMAARAGKVTLAEPSQEEYEGMLLPYPEMKV